jgi:hypothetical protein
MSDRDDEPSGTIFPGVVILLAMAVLVGTLVSIRTPVASVRIWVPVQSSGAHSVGTRSTSPCSPVSAGCNPADPV